MKKPPLLALDKTHRAIGGFPLGLSVQRDPQRKTARRFLPHDLDRTDGLAARPLLERVKALLAERAVTQPDCL